MWFCPTCKIPVNQQGICPKCGVQHTPQTAVNVQNPQQAALFQQAQVQSVQQVVPPPNVLPVSVAQQPLTVQASLPQTAQVVQQVQAVQPSASQAAPSMVTEHLQPLQQGSSVSEKRTQQRNTGYIGSSLSVMAIATCIVSVGAIFIGLYINILFGFVGIGAGAILSFFAVQQVRNNNLTGGGFITAGKFARVVGLILFVGIFLYGMVMQMQTFDSLTSKFPFLSSFSNGAMSATVYEVESTDDAVWGDFATVLNTHTGFKNDVDLAERLSKLVGVHTSSYDGVTHNSILIVDGSGNMYVSGKRTGLFEGGLRLVYSEVSRVTLYSEFGFAYGGVSVYASKYSSEEDLNDLIESARAELPVLKTEEKAGDSWFDWFR